MGKRHRIDFSKIKKKISDGLVVLSLKLWCKNKENFYTCNNLFYVKRRQDHFYNYNVDCAGCEKYDGGYVWYPAMCF